MTVVTWLAEHRAAKDDLLRSVAKTADDEVRLPFIPMSLRGFPETIARVDDCLARAKKQPKGAVARSLKRALITLQYNGARRYFARRPGQVALAWNGLTGSRRAFLEAARDAGAGRLFMELAPLPGRITLDAAGVNAEGSVPRDPAAFANVTPDADLIRDLGAGLTARTSRRPDVGQGEGALPDSPFLFVPLQVPDDSQMRLFADWVGDMPGFVAALATASHALPPGWHLRMKEHPSSKIPLTAEIDAAIAAGARIVRDNDTDSYAQLRASRGVVTANSSMGLQAFFFDKPVIVTGRAFFALPGLAKVARDAAQLAAAFAAPPDPGFDSDLRARFLTWLARAYYPTVMAGAVNPDAARAKLAEATP